MFNFWANAFFMIVGYQSKDENHFSFSGHHEIFFS